MLGAIIGDIIGSRFERHNIKTKDFCFFTQNNRPTDDSIMTIAVAKAILECGGDSDTIAAIAGGVAEAYYGVPELTGNLALEYLPNELFDVVIEFEEKYC